MEGHEDDPDPCFPRSSGHEKGSKYIDGGKFAGRTLNAPANGALVAMFTTIGT